MLCGGLLILFGGVTDRLIPLYAVGAFLAFTLSQAGMVMHWRKNRGPHWLEERARQWAGRVVSPASPSSSCWLRNSWKAPGSRCFSFRLTIFFFTVVRRHYHSVKMLTTCKVPVDAAGLSQPPIAVIPIDRWSNITRQGIEFAARLSPEVIALHVEPNEHSELLQDDWERYVEQPFRAAGKEPPKLQILPSPYRFIIIPIVQFILDLSKKNPDRSIIVVIPELVEDKWYEYFLHNQRGRLLEWVLLARGNERIFTVSAPWYVRHQS